MSWLLFFEFMSWLLNFGCLKFETLLYFRCLFFNGDFDFDLLWCYMFFLNSKCPENELGFY